MAEPGTARLVVSSEGGSSWASAHLSLILQEYGLTLVIEDYCLSSCAEYLLPSAPRVIVRSDAVIGFHGNPLLEEHLLAEAGSTKKFCGVESGNVLRYLYGRSGAKVDFWVYQNRVLRPHSVKVVSGPDCETVEYDREVDMWLPSRTEIESLLGVDLSGPVCADNASCVREKALPLLGRGAPIVAAGVLFSESNLPL